MPVRAANAENTFQTLKCRTVATGNELQKWYNGKTEGIMKDHGKT